MRLKVGSLTLRKFIERSSRARAVIREMDSRLADKARSKLGQALDDPDNRRVDWAIRYILNSNNARHLGYSSTDNADDRPHRGDQRAARHAQSAARRMAGRDEDWASRTGQERDRASSHRPARRQKRTEASKRPKWRTTTRSTSTWSTSPRRSSKPRSSPTCRGRISGPCTIPQARWIFCVAHRRAGKTVALVNQLIRAALSNPRRHPPPRYAYVGPSFDQVKDLCWGYLKHYAGGYPGVRFLEGELTVIFPTGATIRLYGGGQAYERIRGIYLDGAVLDEYPLLNRARLDFCGPSNSCRLPRFCDHLRNFEWRRSFPCREIAGGGRCRLGYL